ncbi:hypothetical protein [Pseudonocardia oroxyli]|nr:hypothetical protein [Pseudonocardia oroxyli]
MTTRNDPHYTGDIDVVEVEIRAGAELIDLPATLHQCMRKPERSRALPVTFTFTLDSVDPAVFGFRPEFHLRSGKVVGLLGTTACAAPAMSSMQLTPTARTKAFSGYVAVDSNQLKGTMDSDSIIIRSYRGPVTHTDFAGSGFCEESRKREFVEAALIGKCGLQS